ncbi:MAG: efflux RND transporter periplasmic adaptor subunit [bacterium]
MKKTILPIAILLISIALVLTIYKNPPEAHKKKPKPQKPLLVEVLTIVPQKFTVPIETQGRVQTRVKMPLQSKVSGKITWISPGFNSGESFLKGQPLVNIDDRDYKLQLIIAEAELESARQALAEEQARVKQAKDDWKNGGKKGKAPALVLREPQLATAKAKVEAAKARVSLAKHDLDYTRITAPYDGRVLSLDVTQGQWANINSVLATIYAYDDLQIELPIKSRDYAFLPDQISGHPVSIEMAQSKVLEAQLTRKSASLDSLTQQASVYASSLNNSLKNIPLDQFVSVNFEGKSLNKAIIIPTSSIYEGSYVYLVKQGKLDRHEITINWQNQDSALIGQGLESGDVLVLTSLGQVLSGTAVKVKKQ